MAAAPSPEFQLAFLSKLQRIVDEGDFTATYKFALLIALGELAVERGHDDDQPLPIETRAIGEKFAELYWKQILPYSASGRTPGMLSQIHADAAAVPNRLAAFRAETGVASLAAARKHADWPSVIASISRTVRDQPIRYLQNVGGQTISFLYEIGPGPGSITLLPGVAYALRRFQGFVIRLAQAGWVRHVRENPRNRPLIGEAGDLEAFMFEQSRQTLAAARLVLADAQANRCFYCEARLTGGDVDHFIPWVRYPRDLAENFVLAHAACNRAKSDMLAAPLHAARWAGRNRTGGPIIEGLTSAGLVSDGPAIAAVARWAYGEAARAGARLWLSSGVTVDADGTATVALG